MGNHPVYIPPGLAPLWKTIASHSHNLASVPRIASHQPTATVRTVASFPDSLRLVFVSAAWGALARYAARVVVRWEQVLARST
eukprot:1195499-Amphidinium_carterae.1